MKILVTGFEPFGGEKINPAFEAIKLLPNKIKNSEIIKLEIPTIFFKSSEVIKKAIEDMDPDVIVSVGQAGGRSAVTIEKVAVNLIKAKIADNEGNKPLNKKIREDGESSYFSKLPNDSCIKNVRDNNIPCFESYSAGTYVCNNVMYDVLYMIERFFPDKKSGFVHVPYTPEQVVNKKEGTPSMNIKDISKALFHIIEALIDNRNNIIINGGNIC